MQGSYLLHPVTFGGLRQRHVFVGKPAYLPTCLPNLSIVYGIGILLLERTFKGLLEALSCPVSTS